VNMTIDQFWGLVAESQWDKDHDSDRIKLELLQKLTPEEAGFMRGILHRLTTAIRGPVGRFYDAADEWLSDDGLDDLCNHIVGLGQEAYEEVAEKPQKALDYSDSYVESFGYAVPFADDFRHLDPEVLRDRLFGVFKAYKKQVEQDKAWRQLEAWWRPFLEGKQCPDSVFIMRYQDSRGKLLKRLRWLINELNAKSHKAVENYEGINPHAMINVLLDLKAYGHIGMEIEG